MLDCLLTERNHSGMETLTLLSAGFRSSIDGNVTSECQFSYFGAPCLLSLFKFYKAASDAGIFRMAM